MARYKENVVKYDKTNKILFPDRTSFLQFVVDNTDLNLAHIDGKNKHQGPLL